MIRRNLGRSLGFSASRRAGEEAGQPPPVLGTDMAEYKPTFRVRLEASPWPRRLPCKIFSHLHPHGLKSQQGPPLGLRHLCPHK